MHMHGWTGGWIAHVKKMTDIDAYSRPSIFSSMLFLFMFSLLKALIMQHSGPKEKQRKINGGMQSQREDRNLSDM